MYHEWPVPPSVLGLVPARNITRDGETTLIHGSMHGSIITHDVSMETLHMEAQ